MVCTYSTVFPKGHPREGQPTYFVEKILAGEKIHTIRAGHRWKDGDMMDYMFWSGKPYRSPMKRFKDPMSVYPQDIFMRWHPSSLPPLCLLYIFINGVYQPKFDINQLAVNDGLEPIDFYAWFLKQDSYGTFSGQIIYSTEFRY